MNDDETLSEADIAELESDIATIEPTPPKPITAVTVATEEECARFVEEVAALYPGIGVSRVNNTLAILGVMQRTNYRPHPILYANRKSALCEQQLMLIVQRHLSSQMLRDLTGHLVDWAVDHPTCMVKDELIAVFETEDGGMTYSNGGTEVESSASEAKEGWASW